MKLEKAIQLLTLGSDGNLDATWEEYANALKLGIEALKAIIKARDIPYATPAHYLPGETEE